MKKGSLFRFANVMLVCLALLPALSAANAADNADTPSDALANLFIVIDKDPRGTNLRDAPSGNILRTLPKAPVTEPYLVSVVEARNGWFKVYVNGQQGWMHGSVLGVCSSASEEGEPPLFAEPIVNGKPISPRLPYGAPLIPLDLRKDSDSWTGWVKVRYTDAKGKTHQGWLPNHVLAHGYSLEVQCAAVWAAHK